MKGRYGGNEKCTTLLATKGAQTKAAYLIGMKQTPGPWECGSTTHCLCLFEVSLAICNNDTIFGHLESDLFQLHHL